MEASVDWYIEGKVVFAQFRGDGDLETIAWFAEKVSAMIDAGNPPVHLVMDISEVGKPTLDIGELKSTLAVLSRQETGWVLTVGKETNRLINFIASATAQFIKVRYRSLDTLEEAIAFLENVDALLYEPTSAER